MFTSCGWNFRALLSVEECKYIELLRVHSLGIRIAVTELNDSVGLHPLALLFPFPHCSRGGMFSATCLSFHMVYFHGAPAAFHRLV